MLQGQKDLNTVGRLILSELAPVVAAQHAVFYILDAGQPIAQLTLLASYASEGRGSHGKRLNLGEGLVGQCAVEKQKILLDNVPQNYIRIASGLGEAPPRNILVLPVVFEGNVKAVLELASLEGFGQTHQAFLEQLTESIGIVINTIEANMRTEDLLKQSQSLAQELGSRQEELQQTNEELQEKARLLAHQNQEVERKNSEVEQARQALEEKATQLALTSKYKSEFLANMSHELRTPLNSLLILSDQLCTNPQGNLTAKQVEFAKSIHSSGNDLLMLINDILDLSKIESGTVLVDIGEVRLTELRAFVERTFRHMAESKGVEFALRLDQQLPKSVSTDSKRLQQILKNLLSNAFKFTHYGQVTLTIEPSLSGWSEDNEELSRAPAVVAFSVSDTGIGIAPDKQQIIFEAFQQADGSTSRKYGGTGLGLAISRELSRLLGGEIRLTSTPGRGSTFTLYLPANFPQQRSMRKATDTAAAARAANENGHSGGNNPASARVFPILREPSFVLPASSEPVLSVDELGDDRDSIQPGDCVLLIVENDHRFARFMLDTARERGFKGLVTSLGAAALAMVREYKPTAITLDISLPDLDGWRVLERLKNDISHRHVPVHVISTEDAGARALHAGARRFLAKPIQSKDLVDRFLDDIKSYAQRGTDIVLAVGSEETARAIERTIDSADDVEVIRATDAEAAVQALRERQIALLVLDAHAPELFSAVLASQSEEGELENKPPVVIFGNGADVALDDARWERLARARVVRKVESLDRLLDQSTLLLHHDASKLSDTHRTILADLYLSNKSLAGKRVLIVDDDMRNIFALASVLEEYEISILSADNGPDAIGLMQKEPGIDAILMDIMMPEMDGLDTTRAIRALPEGKAVPIIAVTAKAMKGDRDRCLEAGAWDYLSKPVDREQLLSTLRAWFHR